MDHRQRRPGNRMGRDLGSLGDLRQAGKIRYAGTSNFAAAMTPVVRALAG